MASLRTTASRHLRSWVKSESAVAKSRTRALTATSTQQGNTTISSQLRNTRQSQHHSDYLPNFQPRADHHLPLASLRSKTPFDDLINDITRSLTTVSRPSLPHLHNLLRSYTPDSDHWSKYAHGNPAKQYTRNLVYSVPGIFNLLLLVWTPGQKSPVHDHADAHCLMKVCQY